MIKSFLWIVFLAFGLQAAWGFALLGPLPSYPGLPANFGDNWQTAILDYGFGEVGGPKNLGEEYRRNTPVLYYAYDANFLDFFGSNGVSAVDSAFSIVNGLTNVDSYSPDLSEFPLNAQGINWTAQAAGLVDLKSTALAVLMEQMGLAEPERYVWTLHDRFLPPRGQCPADELYLVVQRNFNFMPTPPDLIQYSSYINGTLYSYYIVENCQAPPPWLAGTVPFSPDPFASTFTAVAGLISGLNLGGFYTGLTRDDVGGLRYLMSTNTQNWESPAAGSVLTSSTSSGGGYLEFLLYTSNYTAFAQAALTNNPVTLSNLFPGLVIASSSNHFVVVPVVTTTAYYTHHPGDDAGTSNLVVLYSTNYIPMTYYSYTFANLIVITNGYHTNTSGELLTVSLGHAPGSDSGSPPVTNFTYTSVTLNNGAYNTVWPSGEYYIDTNYACGPTVILGTLLTNVVATTNIIYAVSNSPASQSIVTYSTTHVFDAQSPVCAVVTTGGVTNAAGLYQGIGKVQFVSAPFDSLLGQTFQPITNTYTMIVISGSKATTNKFQRVVTAPDIVFSAFDWADPNPAVPEIGVAIFGRNVNFNINNILANLAGPGTIDPPTIITLNKVGDVYGNGSLSANFLSTNQFLSEFTQMKGGYWPANHKNGLLAWASFDSSTNDPVVYPNGASIQNLENQILVQISFSPSTTNSTLLNGTNNQPYTNTIFTASGGAFTRPFTWSATGLPDGLTVTTTNSTALLSGKPTVSGSLTLPHTFDFTLQLSDTLTPPRTVQWTFAITIQ